MPSHTERALEALRKMRQQEQEAAGMVATEANPIPFAMTPATAAEMVDCWLLSGCPGNQPVEMGAAMLRLKLAWRPRDRGTKTKRARR